MQAVISGLSPMRSGFMTVVVLVVSWFLTNAIKVAVLVLLANFLPHTDFVRSVMVISVAIGAVLSLLVALFGIIVGRRGDDKDMAWFAMAASIWAPELFCLILAVVGILLGIIACNPIYSLVGRLNTK